MSDWRERDSYTGLDALESFEIYAQAFHAMVGMMAPGKSESPIMNSGHTSEERREAYDKWHAEHGKTVRAVLHAYNEILPRADP